ncbi:hypothetical protein DI09_1p30 [Mitosporidium daphniae]|uniref:RFX-type winged-helix domain-containing protein n=1 Tax=Mitosporidium daphniae TaxID=1485682 RepID=A0A098VST4_9MICR|nr:uncharacterized protein DI09_1p30 [Mitosporidium daphniae]KGG52153.1 hypothetical protein DI09_1p30 [Mitosporidium daphniae]|eukprot:XP_013238648.1 uncharacterized protein DI09_1p30 [Mitosporidium daphniae]
MMTSDYIQEDQEAISLKIFGAADIIINSPPSAHSSFHTNFHSAFLTHSPRTSFTSSAPLSNFAFPSDFQAPFAQPGTALSLMAPTSTASISHEQTAALLSSNHYFSSAEYSTSTLDTPDYGESTSVDFPLSTSIDFGGSQTEFIGSPEYISLSSTSFSTAPFECLSAPPSFGMMGHTGNGHNMIVDYVTPSGGPTWHHHQYGSEQGAPVSSMTAIKGKSPYVVLWLQSHFESSEGVSMPRSLLYTHYYESCVADSIEPVNAASFGKIIRSVFPNLRTRRLGTRGHSKYHYYGIRMKAPMSTAEAAPALSSPVPNTGFGSSSYGAGTGTVETVDSIPHSIKSHFTIRPSRNRQTSSPVTIYSLATGGLSCVTANPPSIDRFAARLHMAAPDALPIEHGDLFRLGLQHHTTLLLSLILREEYLQFEEEFTLYWLGVFPKSFPEFQASNANQTNSVSEISCFFPSQKSENRSPGTRLYQSILSMIQRFDATSLAVIQECFLASFWTNGITQAQLENVRLFCTKTLPGLITMLVKGYFSARDLENVQFDVNGWPTGQPWHTPATLPSKLLVVKLEFFKKLSMMLLKRVSLHSLATTLRSANGVVIGTAATKCDFSSSACTNRSPSASLSAPGSAELRRLARAAVREAASELQRHVSHERDCGLRAQAFALGTDPSLSASFSRSIDEMDASFIPEEILAQFITSMELIFGDDQLDWDAWASFLDSCVDYEASEDTREGEENCRHLDAAAKRKNGALPNIGPISYGELERMQRHLQNLLIQWSFVIAIFMDQLFATRDHKKVEGSCARDEEILAEYLHFDQGACEAATPVGDGASAVVVAQPAPAASTTPLSLFETVRLLTEEYLLYLVEQRLDELRDACASSSTSGLIGFVMEPNFLCLKSASRRREKRTRKKTFDESLTAMEPVECAFIQGLSITDATLTCGPLRSLS